MTEFSKEFWDQHAEWSRATFGSDAERGPLGPLKHLEKEAKEAQIEALEGNKNLLYNEIVDCQFLVFDVARRAGMSHFELFEQCFEKLEINKSRKWPKLSSDEPVEHEK